MGASRNDPEEFSGAAREEHLVFLVPVLLLVVVFHSGSGVRRRNSTMVVLLVLIRAYDVVLFPIPYASHDVSQASLTPLMVSIVRFVSYLDSLLDAHN